DMLVAPMNDVNDKLVKGICGQVPGSIIPGMMGMEAGQSAFGDVYAWFRNLIAYPFKNIFKNSSIIEASVADLLQKEFHDKIISELSDEAAKLPLHENDELAIDWLNGRR